MKRIECLLKKYATGKVVLVLFILTTLVYLTMLLYTIPVVVSFAPDMVLFDLSPGGYSLDYAVSLLEALGSDGRAEYLKTQLPLDFIYLGLFAVTCSLLLIWLYQKVPTDVPKVQNLSIVPISVGLFDYSENILIISMIKSFPDVSEIVVMLSSIFTILKSGFTIVFIILFFGGVVRFLIAKYYEV
ncbi:hypothetical protein [Photobacterium profundum]|uniref:hypothetical protein n=1 Tax=Photobacterium profundum TaxID=74109 RepID=UPI003D1504BF